MPLVGSEAALPAGFWARVQQIADEAVLRFSRSGFLRNSSISGGTGLTVQGAGGITIDGGSLRVIGLPGASSSTVYLGGIAPNMPDGNPQPGVIFRREDGTIALAMYDPTPDPLVGDGFNQFLAIYDRSGNIVLSDDTAAGQGLARPYVGADFYRARYADWVTTTSTAFESLFVAVLNKQHPQLYVQAQASNDTSGATGEVRVLVNGAQWGPTLSTAFAIATKTFGPLPVAGAHMASLKVELQARLATGTGGVRLEPSVLTGRQS